MNMTSHCELSLVPSPTYTKMAAARNKWVWHILLHFLGLLSQDYQDPGKPISLQPGLYCSLLEV